MMGVRSLGWEDLLEEGMATHSSILAWRIPQLKRLGTHTHTLAQSGDTAQVTQASSWKYKCVLPSRPCVPAMRPVFQDSPPVTLNS